MRSLESSPSAGSSPGGDAQGLRDEQVVLGERVLRLNPLPGIPCGDVNATLWSLPLRELRERGVATPAALGQGIMGSWTTELWFTGMILIDRLWVEARVGVEAFRVGAHFGSDHRGVTAGLVY